MEISRIVVAADRSASSMSALREGRRLAASLGASLVVMHIIRMEQAERIMAETGINAVGVRSSMLESFSNYVRENLEPGAESGIEVSIGHLSHSVVERCEKERADLLVIGAEEEDEWESGRGVLARKRARWSPATVLTCRGTSARRCFRRIVTCLDFSPGSILALQVARELARVEGAELHVLHVALPGLPFASDEQKHQSAIVERLRAEATGDPGLPDPVCHVVTSAEPARAITSFLRLRRADLAVLGCKGRSNLASMLMGSVSEQVIESSPCSVLTVKPKFDYER